MLFDLTAVGTAAVGVIAGAVGAYAALRRDDREARAQNMTEARDTIGLLREQTEILKEHGQTREAEWRQLEEQWRRREERFEARVSDLERDYRQLVLTVTTMGLCANAPECPSYDPGDRRRGAAGAAQPPPGPPA